MDLTVKTVAFQGAPNDLHETGQKKLRTQFPEITFRFLSQHPDVIYFLSGGSEQEAIMAMQPGKYQLLLAGFENNAFAAALEVKAWAENRKISTSLFLLPEAEKEGILQQFARICSSLRTLSNKQAGLIGNVSHWLVASEFPLILAKERFGINILHLQWSSLPDYMNFEPDSQFLKVFSQPGNRSLMHEASFCSFLWHVINTFNLSGITVECFQLVNERNVTACLALALLNSNGIVAGCEGDLVSMVGMMLVQTITGNIPWMANVAGFTETGLLFAHCTAPTNLLDRIELPVHFETGKSAAITGNLKMDEVTVFRLNQNLDKAFITTGKIISRPRHGFACRTQAEITIPEEGYKKLRNQPLGNHHLIVPGRHEDMLALTCRYKQIQVI